MFQHAQGQPDVLTVLASDWPLSLVRQRNAKLVSGFGDVRGIPESHMRPSLAERDWARHKYVAWRATLATPAGPTCPHSRSNSALWGGGPIDSLPLPPIDSRVPGGFFGCDILLIADERLATATERGFFWIDQSEFNYPIVGPAVVLAEDIVVKDAQGHYVDKQAWPTHRRGRDATVPLPAATRPTSLCPNGETAPAAPGSGPPTPARLGRPHPVRPPAVPIIFQARQVPGSVAVPQPVERGRANPKAATGEPHGLPMGEVEFQSPQPLAGLTRQRRGHCECAGPEETGAARRSWRQYSRGPASYRTRSGEAPSLKV